MDEIGLTTLNVRSLLGKNGPNEIPREKSSKIKKLIKWFISPIVLMLVIASVLSFISEKTFDGFLILFLMIMNISIGFWQENKADNAIAQLNKSLSSRVKVARDGRWQLVDSRGLVTGDLIEVHTGEVIPADGEIMESKNLSLNESALTGESLPKDKKEKEPVYSGSYIATGFARIRLTATGKNTYFGKTIFSIEKGKQKSELEKDILRISSFLSTLSVAGVAILTLTFLAQKASITDLLTLDLSLVIAGIPISLPTVMTLIIEFGVIELAKKKVIVRRLSALEDLANVNLLLTDKTGTLTENKITVKEIVNYSKKTEKDLITLAFLAAKEDGRDSINQAIIQKAAELKIDNNAFKTIDFIPADSDRKRSTIKIIFNHRNYLVSLGAPQVILPLCQAPAGRSLADISRLARSGYRTLALAIAKDTDEEKNMELLGFFALSDTIRTDAREVIDFMKENAISVVMLTGDNKAIALEVAKNLNLSEKILARGDLADFSSLNRVQFLEIGAFAEILPKDKYSIVKKAKDFFTVAVNGDGVNDLPAVKEANVGIAVKNAVDALKSTADIVLLSEGISFIKDAILQSRKIFSRLYSYSTYRISESLRLVITITVLGILYRQYPLTPIQLILLALLNDIPIISLAFDKVKITNRPDKVNVRARFLLSSLYGMAGVGNSLILFFLITSFTNLSWSMIQTIYFLKLTVSGHMLIYVARTREKWFKFLPSNQVIWATTITQLAATTLALTGLFMPSVISLKWVIIVWLWSFLWMQISELLKHLYPSSPSETSPET